ncbi:hypothetical protein LIER_16818 [Lithospermum erythrorhizon]|uniref:Uncharacterized protein n=1 Tax=Lithospermum erythrorhizon TaxID=34254 RepID=A0AAV3Q839_LITER
MENSSSRESKARKALKLKVSFINAFLFASLVIAAMTASAQDMMEPAPAPDAGAGYSLPVSSATVVASLVFSLVALMRH